MTRLGDYNEVRFVGQGGGRLWYDGAMTEAILASALSTVAGLYDVKLTALAQLKGSLEALYRQWRQHGAGVGKVASLLGRSWREPALAAAAARLKNSGIQALVLGDDAYPPPLAAIDDPPYVLYLRGDCLALAGRLIAVVGTRASSSYGRRATASLMAGLAGQKVSIVSGLALGIDAMAHRAALDAGLTTVAVLGGGLDAIEPKTNHALGLAVMAHGCVISEYPPGVRPQKHHFLARNRLIAGLVELVIVVEGTLKSGALVTARLALKSGRDVGAVPGDIFTPNSAGPHALLADGAIPIISSEAIRTTLKLAPAPIPATDSSLISFLRQPITVDDLATLAGLDIRAARIALTELELAGRVAITAGGLYYRK